MKKLFFMGVIMLVFIGNFMAQQPTQNIKGRVVDVDTHQPIPGVNVYIMGTNPPLGGITDYNGNFLLEDVPIGRYNIQFSFMGYESAVLNAINVGSGKEVELNVSLKENFQQLEEVVVKPKERKDKPQNTMATLSARSFSVEEAMCYAGGWNDPSRLAGSFAGVSMAEGVNDNSIVIRGNAPKGILWRLEGVEIPAPNHLNGVNNGGGIETVFSVNMLANSDFFTGAFPAEYGNAMSGTFDIKFRNGNNNKRESTFQFGSQGIDVSSEGPFKKGTKSSYLFNYRYSTLGIIGSMLGGDYGWPNYQDLSFKVNLPTLKAGEFSIWGIAGLSNVSFDPDEDPNKWTNTFDNNMYNTSSDIVASGITHKANVSKNSYLSSSLAFTYDRFKMKSDQIQRNGGIIPLSQHKEDNDRIIASTFLNHKFSSRHTNRTGVTYTKWNYSLDVLGNPEPGEQEELIRIADQSGNTEYLRAYTQSKWRVAPTFDVNAGISVSYLGMNDEFVVEPRLGTTWRFAPKHAVSLAYGKHSKIEPIRFYQSRDDKNNWRNPDLKVTKAHHLVFSYDYLINNNIKFKMETYYQYLYDVPVIDGLSTSLINYEWDMYFNDALVNDGTGTNVGVDITLERYMKDGIYYMFTGSFFNSKYIGGDHTERNTSFNRNVVLNFLGGKEWEVRKNNVIGISGKLSFMGGNRFTPPDQEASKMKETVVLDDDKAFEWQEDSKLFLDLAFNYKVNKEKVAHVFSLQGKNILMQSEMYGWAYDFKEQKVVEHGETMIYPFFTYRLEF